MSHSIWSSPPCRLPAAGLLLLAYGVLPLQAEAAAVKLDTTSSEGMIGSSGVEQEANTGVHFPIGAILFLGFVVLYLVGHCSYHFFRKRQTGTYLPAITLEKLIKDLRLECGESNFFKLDHVLSVNDYVEILECGLAFLPIVEKEKRSKTKKFWALPLHHFHSGFEPGPISSYRSWFEPLDVVIATQAIASTYFKLRALPTTSVQACVVLASEETNANIVGIVELKNIEAQLCKCPVGAESTWPLERVDTAADARFEDGVVLNAVNEDNVVGGTDHIKTASSLHDEGVAGLRPGLTRNSSSSTFIARDGLSTASRALKNLFRRASSYQDTEHDPSRNSSRRNSGFDLESQALAHAELMSPFDENTNTPSGSMSKATRDLLGWPWRITKTRPPYSRKQSNSSATDVEEGLSFVANGRDNHAGGTRNVTGSATADERTALLRPDRGR